MKQEKTTKSSNGLLIAVIILSIFLAVSLVLASLGWGLYFWQKHKSGQEISNSNSSANKFTGKELIQPQEKNDPYNIATNPQDNIATSYQENSFPPEPVQQPEESGISNVADTSSENEGFLPPTSSEKNMGYIKKAYAKGGKNYLDIDYIQWLTGTEAEKAMREDGQCPLKGECIVYDDYYIRNQNPLVRTFEIPPNAQIHMQTLDLEKDGIIQDKEINFEKFKSLFGSSSEQHFQFVPFIIEIGNKQILKITEQYIP